MQSIKLNLIPGSVLPVVNVSQYDAHRQFQLVVYEGATSYSLTGKTVEIRGTKPDGNGFAYDAQDGVVSVSGNTVTISTTQQMTAVGGQTMAELRIKSGTTILGTINFILDVEHSALSDDTPISDTDIPAIERDFEAALEEAQEAAETATTKAGEASTSATNAAGSATSAAADALKAEGYAVGKQNGSPVGSGSPYYNNNAEYYDTHASEQAYNAGQSATAAAADSLEAEGWAVGEQGGTPVGPTSPYYQNNAAYYAAQAGQYATGGLIFKGSVAFANIPTTGMVNGDMYNITDDFTTDSRFIEGAGMSVKAGADIAYVAGSVNKWDILALGGGGGADALDDLTDVTITSPAEGDLLQYNGTSGEWENSNAVPQELAAMQKVGAVNLLPNNATANVISGVVFTPNADGSITITSESEVSNAIDYYINNNAVFPLVAGKYTLSLGNPNPDNIGFRIMNGGKIVWDKSWGWTYTFASTYTNCRAIVRVLAGFIGTVTVYPMMRDYSFSRYTYYPAALSNRALTEYVNSGVLQSILPWRSLPGTTANTREPGIYFIGSGSSVTHLPTGSTVGGILVCCTRPDNTNVGYQLFIVYTNVGTGTNKLYFRDIINAFSKWHLVSSSEVEYNAT